jgi:hypothetical protein
VSAFTDPVLWFVAGAFSLYLAALIWVWTYTRGREYPANRGKRPAVSGKPRADFRIPAE